MLAPADERRIVPQLFLLIGDRVESRAASGLAPTRLDDGRGELATGLPAGWAASTRAFCTETHAICPKPGPQRLLALPRVNDVSHETSHETARLE